MFFVTKLRLVKIGYNNNSLYLQMLINLGFFSEFVCVFLTKLRLVTICYNNNTLYLQKLINLGLFFRVCVCFCH